MNTLTQVILVRHDGALILRSTGDDLISALGGPVIDGLTPHASAEEYLYNQTNLPHDGDNLIFWRRYGGSTYVFLVHSVSSADLREHWGDELVVVRSPHDAHKINLSADLRRAITDYYHEVERA